MSLPNLLSRKSKNTILSLCIMLTLVLGFSLPAAAAVANSPEIIPTQSAAGAFTDIPGHWAAPQINEWLSKGLAQGYPDGTFKPDNQVTRAEFITLTNRVLGYQANNPVNFSDVSASDWFAEEAAKAQTAGYITGYPDGTLRPLSGITRQEAAVMMTRAVKMTVLADFSVLEKFKDAAAIPNWSRGAVSTVVSDGYMQGYPDQTFKANGMLSRAEAIAILNRAFALPASPQKAVSEFAKSGIYGPAAGSEQINGDVTISAAGITLQNMHILGNLTLTSGIKDGDVTLKNVTVNGSCTIDGGGAGAEVILNGSFNQVTVAAPKVNLSISGSVKNLEVSEKAGGAVINIASSAKVSKLILNSAVSVTGKGSIKTAVINVSGSTLEPKPAVVEKLEDVTVNIGSATSSGGNKGTGPGTGTGTGDGNNPLNFVSSDPADGSTGVSIMPTISLAFDRGVTRDYWEHNQDCITLKNSSNQSVAIRVFRSSNYLTDEDEKRVIYVTPETDLSAGKTYTLKIAADLTANNGNTLGEETTISFKVAGGGGGNGGGGGSGDGDKSGANAALTVVDNKTAGAIFDLSLTACKNSSGAFLTGAKAVTVTSDKDGQVFSEEVTFTEGNAAVTIEADQVKTAGINTLTIVIAGVTPQPKVAVTVVPATQISSANSSTVLDPALVKGGTSTLTLTLRDAYNNPLTNAVKNLKIVVSITNNNATTDEMYQIDGEAISVTTTLTKSGVLLDTNGQITYTLILPAVIDAADGLAVQVTQNNDTAIGSTFSYLEPAISNGEISSAHSTAAIEPALAKGGTNNLIITLKDAANNPLADVTKNLKLVLTVVNNDLANNEVYFIDGEAITATATLSMNDVLFNADGQKIYSVILPATIDPGDGISIQVTQKNGIPIGSAITYMEWADLSGFSAALAVPGDKTAGTSFDLSINGAKDTSGTFLAGAKAVSVTSDKDGLVFTGEVDFTEGAAIVSLATGKVITAGSSQLTVEIAGITEQPVVSVTVTAASQISAKNSDATIDPALAIGGNSTLTVTLKDAYNNPMANTTKNLLLAVTVTNNTATTNESYTIDGTSVTATTTLTKSGLLFDGSGQKTFNLDLPPTIDAGDGLAVQVTQNNGTPLGSSFAFYAE